MRRNQHTAQHPDVEEVRVERDIIEGQKNTLQTEILGMATNKKELEISFENAKKRLGDEFEKKKHVLDQEILAIEAKRDQANAEKDKAEKEAETATQETERIVSEMKTCRESLSSIVDSKEKLQNSCKDLTKEKSHLEARIHELSPIVKELENRERNLVKDIAVLQQKKISLTTEISESTLLISGNQIEHKKVTDQKHQASVLLDETNKKIEQAELRLSTVHNELVDVQKEISEQKQGIQKRESDINDRMGNLARLEVTIDKKRDELKEIEDHFTTEHLGRMGYRKLT